MLLKITRMMNEGATGSRKENDPTVPRESARKQKCHIVTKDPFRSPTPLSR